MVPYEPGFKLYMTSRLPNPHYPPETCVKVNLLNFMATEDGLMDQMLGVTVKQAQAEALALQGAAQAEAGQVAAAQAEAAASTQRLEAELEAGRAESSALRSKLDEYCSRLVKSFPLNSSRSSSAAEGSRGRKSAEGIDCRTPYSTG